jgi:ATP-binding cassette subfamily B protein
MDKQKVTGGFRKEFKTLKPYFYRYRVKYLAGFVCLFVVDAAQLLIPQFTKKAIDLISSGVFQFKNILALSLLMIGTIFVIALGRFLWRLLIHGSSRRIEKELRDTIFDHLLNLSWDVYQKNKIGDLMARSTSDLASVRMAMGWGLVAGLDGSVMALAILIIIFVQDTGTAFFAVLPLPLITVLIIFFGTLVGKRFKKSQEANSALSETVQETFAGIRVIKSFVKESWFIKKFAENNDDYRDANMSVVKIHGLFMPLITFLSGFTSIIVILVGGGRVVLGLMTPGDLVALFTYIQMLIWPMLGAGFTVNMMQRGIVSLRRINGILETPPSIKTIQTIQNAKGVSSLADTAYNNIIEIKNLTFSYNTGKDVLKDINISLCEGATLGILGKTGSGKSTLIKILPRMLDPPFGTVFVKGRDVRNWDLNELRSQFGLSPQDSFMFSDTIKNNMLYGIEDADDGLIKLMTGLSALDRDIENFSSGLQTLIGEKGLTLSGGQKQRLAIARALIARPAILILDDSLSAVDAETEKRIVSGVYEERKNKTTIIISHRVSAFAHADFVAVMDDGKLVEYGTPSRLLAEGGYYAKTAALQQLYE